MNHRSPLLEAHELIVGYKLGKRRNKTVAGPLHVEIMPGEMVCLLGPNGSGKSTLMRTLSGLQPALAGKVAIARESIQKMKPVELARRLSMVLTERIETGNLTVYELVALGRYPYTGWLGTLTRDDEEKVQWAIEATDTGAFIHRRMHQLSDGERQKVMLARALAQDTSLILLDEPTAHLDLPNRIEMMRLLHRLAQQTQKGILLSTHELDLALQTADKVWLLKPDGELISGAPEDLVLNGTFEAAFDKAGFHFDKLTGTFTIHVAQGEPVYLHGRDSLAFWTQRALHREGFSISQDLNSSCRVEVMERRGKPYWISYLEDSKQEHYSIADLLERLKTVKHAKKPVKL